MRRVLKPDGKLFLVEHVRRSAGAEHSALAGSHELVCSEQHLRRLQHEPRHSSAWFAQAGFAFEQIDKYYVKGQPKLTAFLTRGVARRASA